MDEKNFGSPDTTTTSETEASSLSVRALARKITILAPIAKRDSNKTKRDEANAMLRECYAKMAAFQKAGVPTPTIDMGAL